MRKQAEKPDGGRGCPESEGFDCVAAYLHPWDSPRNEVPEWNQDVERALRRLERTRERVLAQIEPDQRNLLADLSTLAGLISHKKQRGATP